MNEVLNQVAKLPWATVVPWLISLLTIGTTVWVAAQQMAANRVQPFRQKQFELYILATETVGRLASETDKAKWEEARTKFWQLYWGPLCIVEDTKVEEMMVKLGKIIPQEPIPREADEEQVNIRQRLKGPALNLAHAARGATEFRVMAGLSRS
jgi:hypothetical protein